MQNFQFLLPTRIVFGNEVINQIGEEAKNFGKRALIVTDKGVLKTGYVERITQCLAEVQIEAEVFANVDPNPRDKSVDQGSKKAQQFKADLLIGVGGGSAIDTAKAIGVIMQEGGKINDYEGLDRVNKPITPLIAVPTTAGTGTEVTFWSVITDTKRKFKMSIGSPLMAAKVALVDPTLTLTLPKDITAYTGIDALVHSIEGYTATLSQPISDSLALTAIELISNNIRKVYANGKNLSARYEMMLASMLAGIAFGNSDVAAVHCMGEAMGGLYDTPHGVSMAVCLPYCIEYNLISNPEKFAKIAQALGENTVGLSTLAAAKKCIVAIRDLLGDLNIPSARTLGLQKQDLKKLAEAAAANVAVESNPRMLDQQDFLSMFQRAYDND
ncbi:MAG: iron-containing alcohol dehydrogenase [Desulfobacterales bacterium]|nr:MAG: iron-containing alcohol dehydrogenase [Desulfobacterales bacterium]